MGAAVVGATVVGLKEHDSAEIRSIATVTFLMTIWLAEKSISRSISVPRSFLISPNNTSPASSTHETYLKEKATLGVTEGVHVYLEMADSPITTAASLTSTSYSFSMLLT